MNRQIHVQDLGRKDYKAAWEYQEVLFNRIVRLKMKNRKGNAAIKTPNYLLFTEHPPVYTLGKSGDMKHLLLQQKQLTEKGIDFYKINRGGDITYHGPGQLVMYPVLDLENFFTDIHKYLRLLEETVIATLKDYGIKADQSSGETGVWIDPGTPFTRKIAAMGVRSSRWVTMHGLALNVNTDLRYFDHIVPCGIQGKAITSLHRELEGKEPDLGEVKESLLRHFLRVFEAIPAKKEQIF